MKKLVSLLIVLFLSIGIYAQEKALPIHFHGVDVFAMMTPVEPYKQVGTAIVQPKFTSTISQWLDNVMQQAPVETFDAIITRDGVNIQFITYKTEQEERVGIISNVASDEVDVFFLSIPNKKYTLLAKESVGAYVSTDDFHQITEEILSRKFKLKYDAIIVGLTEIQYIIYKL